MKKEKSNLRITTSVKERTGGVMLYFERGNRRILGEAFTEQEVDLLIEHLGKVKLLLQQKQAKFKEMNASKYYSGTELCPDCLEVLEVGQKRLGKYSGLTTCWICPKCGYFKPVDTDSYKERSAADFKENYVDKTNKNNGFKEID